MDGHVRKRGNKYCFVVDIGPDPLTGKRRQKWFSGYKTEREAKKERTRIINEINQGRFVEPSKLTLKAFLHQWIENYAKENCAPRTLQGYEYIIEKHLVPALGKKTIDKIKPLDIQKYYTEKLQRGRVDGKGGLSARTVLHHHRLLHEALEHAVRWQIIPVNPAKSVSSPKAKKAEMNVLTKEQIQTVLEHSKGKSYYHVVFLAIHTGMRRGEIFGLKWKDIDFENQLLSIRRTLQRIKNKGYQLREATKTDGSRRSIALTDSVIQLLKQIQHQQEKDKSLLGTAYDDQDLVFANPHGKFLDMDNLTRYFSRMVKKLDVPYVRFHDLRHCHATILMQQGVHPKIVSERLGHNSTKLTMDTYSHVLPNMQKEAAQKLDDFLR
jgi:integrase